MREQESVIVTLENLQATLQRIADIRGRFESMAPAGVQPESQPGVSFDATLSKAMGEGGTAGAVPENLEALIGQESREQGVDANLLKAIIRHESGFNPKAVSPVGAQGLMQLMPGTAAGLGVKNSFDPAQNIEGGAKYMKSLLQRYHQSVPTALAAYNAGPGAVDRFDGVPPYPETTRYVRNVMQSYQAYQNAGKS